MQTENTYISKWSGKAKPIRNPNPRNGSAYKRLPPGIHSETASPKIAALDPAKIQEKTLGPDAPKTPNIVVTPKAPSAARPSEQSCIGTASSEDASSIKSVGSHLSGRPSTASGSPPDARSHATEEDTGDAGSNLPTIRTISHLQ